MTIVTNDRNVYTFRMDISQTIKALRKKAKLTQQQIAEEIGCSQPNVSYLEKTPASRARPSNRVVEGLKKLAEKHSQSLAA